VIGVANVSIPWRDIHTHQSSNRRQHVILKSGTCVNIVVTSSIMRSIKRTATNMKHISFNQPLFKEEELNVRSNREDLIRQIVEQTDTKNKKVLARRIAVTSNILKWTDTDLHALLKKKGEVSNYSAFINWNLKLDKVS
jgi:hypothetical protein